MGASSSSKLGCWRKISLEATQSCLISDSESWTCFPGLANRTSVSRLIMSSSTAGSIPPCPCEAIRFDSQIPLRTAPISPRRHQKEETLENPNEKTRGLWRNSMLFSFLQPELFCGGSLSRNCAFVWASAFGVWWVYFSLGDYIIAYLFYFSWKKRVGIRKGKGHFWEESVKTLKMEMTATPMWRRCL